MITVGTQTEHWYHTELSEVPDEESYENNQALSLNPVLLDPYQLRYDSNRTSDNFMPSYRQQFDETQRSDYNFTQRDGLLLSTYTTTFLSPGVNAYEFDKEDGSSRP